MTSRQTWLLLALYATTVSAALFAVDLGSEFVKVSLIKPGRVPISVVHNELSKRKTPAVVTFQSKTRVYGEDALAWTTRTPHRVFLRIRDFLGRNKTDPLLRGLLGGDDRWKAPYVYLPSTERDTVQFDVGDDASLTTEEILGSLFSYLKAITKTEAGEEVTDCVIAVPAFFGPVQKRRVLDAAKLADVNVLAVIHAHGAAALQYGIERDFSETPQRIVIYDMGANTVQASLVSYTAYQTKHLGKGVTVGQFEVEDVEWNENLGGDHLDWALVHYFADRFNQKFKADVYTSERAVMKLKKAVAKTKHTLSSNSDAPIYVEELFEGHDYTDKITRAEFDELNEEFFLKAVEPLTALLQRNAVEAANLAAVELIGGGVRVPKVQAVLSEALGSRTLDKHLDGDEAIVMGAGLVAANLSTVFRLRQFGYMDGAVYPLLLQVVEPEGWKPEKDVTALLRPKALLPYMKRLPTKRVVSLFNVSDTDVLQFQIRYNVSDRHPLPPGAPSALYATYNITGLENAAKAKGEGGKIVLHLSADLSGLVEVDRAEYIVEVIEADPPAEPPAAEKVEEEGVSAATSENDSPGAAPAIEAESPAAEVPPPTTVKKDATPKKILKKAALGVSAAEFDQPDMTLSQLRASKSVLRKYARGEAQKKETEKAKNTLESYIVKSQGRIQDDKDVLEVTNEAQREELLGNLAQMEDWLYMDGADASAEVFEEKLAYMKDLGEPVFGRAKELVNRPLSVEKCKQNLEVVEKALNALPEIKPWLTEEIAELAKETDDLRTWLREKEFEQSQLEPHETPAFNTLEVLQRSASLEKLLKRIVSKKPPKPKPPPPNTTESANTTTDTPDPSTDPTEEAEAEAEEEVIKVEDPGVQQHIEL